MGRYLARGQDRLTWQPSAKELAAVHKESAARLWGSVSRLRASEILQELNGSASSQSLDLSGDDDKNKTNRWAVAIESEVHKVMSKRLAAHLENYGNLSQLCDTQVHLSM